MTDSSYGLTTHLTPPTGCEDEMTDTFNVTASYDKPSYNQGDTITATISGGDVLTQTVQGQIGPVALPLVASDGAQDTLNLPQTTVTVTTATSESVVIDTTRPIVDTSPTPRTWTVSANKLSITATA
jgi:hypothetical protein